MINVLMNLETFFKKQKGKIILYWNEKLIFALYCYLFSTIIYTKNKNKHKIGMFSKESNDFESWLFLIIILKFFSLFLFHSKDSSFFLVLFFFLSESFFKVFLNSLFKFFVANKVGMDLNFFVDTFYLANASKFHSVVPESIFSSLSDVRYFLHGLNSFNIKFSIVLNGFVSFLFELKNRIVS